MNPHAAMLIDWLSELYDTNILAKNDDKYCSHYKTTRKSKQVQNSFTLI